MRKYPVARLVKTMTNTLESETLSEPQAVNGQPSGWLKVGVVAAASVLAGGLAAAWWYRNTVKKLHQADEIPGNPHFGILGDDRADG
jgi:hypothetical protein